MNAEHTALVATLDHVVYPPICATAAAAIRALAGEVERLNGRLRQAEDSCVEVMAQREELRAEVAAHEEVYADHRRLVRELDVILNGEGGAAKQASLCDLVGQIAALKKDAERLNWLEANLLVGNFSRAAIDAALADKPRFTDGHGNSLDHLVDEKP